MNIRVRFDSYNGQQLGVFSARTDDPLEASRRVARKVWGLGAVVRFVSVVDLRRSHYVWRATAEVRVDGVALPDIVRFTDHG